MVPTIPYAHDDPVKLESCHAEATWCANIETVVEMSIFNISSFKTTQKRGLCGSAIICGNTHYCDMVREVAPGFQSCKVSVTVYIKHKSGRFCSKFFCIKSMCISPWRQYLFKINNKEIITTCIVFIADFKRIFPNWKFWKTCNWKKLFFSIVYLVYCFCRGEELLRRVDQFLHP